MANKRMFSKQITASDAFLDMPVSSQLLYFHLNMEADDDGFVSNPKRIMRTLNVGSDDLKILLGKRFLLAFESGVVVIKHWLLHNAVRRDMYKETQYLDEKKLLQIKDNNAYTETRNEPVTKAVHRLDKIRLGQDRVESGDKSPTPSEITRNFFDSSSLQGKMISNLMEKGIPEISARAEIEKFISYWTELNKSGTKQRWELQSTFEVGRRLTTWFSKIKEFNKSQKNNVAIII